MDSITQAVLGVAIAHTTLNKHITTRKIVFLGTIVATLPDLDVFVSKLWNDPLAEIELHRGFSHSIFFFVILSFFIAASIKKWFKEETFKNLYITLFLILLTHSFLDIFTTWGTQLFWPFSKKFALKSVFVVDLFYTIPLTMGVILGLKNKRRSFTYAGLFLSSLYLILGLIIQNSVKNIAKEQFLELYAIKNITINVKPTFSNIFLWNVIIQDANGFYVSDYSVFDSKKIQFKYFLQNKNLIDQFNDKNINRLKKISENQYIITENEKGLVFNDLRFGLLVNANNKTQFAFSYQLQPTSSGFKVEELPKNKRDGLELLKNIWLRLTKRAI